MLYSRLAGAIVAAAIALASPFGAVSASAQNAEDILGVPGPIGFDGRDYFLAWSSRPSQAYIKHEYVPEGQRPENYESMVLLEFLAGGLKPIDLARSQIESLNARKPSDPLVNMDMIQNPATGEVILDFVVSSKDDKGEYIVEWNGYRYASVTDGKGTPGGMLFGISHRAYGNDAARTFLTGLREFKAGQIKALSSMKLPSL